MENLKENGDLSDNDVDALIRAHGDGVIDGNDLRRISKLVDDDYKEYLYDDAVSIEELVEIEEKGGDLSQTGIVVKDKKKEIRWLESGNDDKGWIHISARHIIGTDLDGEPSTSFWPLGQTVKGRPLPNTLEKEGVLKLIYKAIKEGERSPQGQKSRYYFQPTEEGYSNSEIDEMRVFVLSNGEIETSYPLSGNAHTKWLDNANDGEGRWEDQDDL